MSHFKKRLTLLMHPILLRYVLSCFFTTVGTGLVYITMSWLIVQAHDSVEGVAILMICFWLPRIIVGPLFGVLADRWPCKWILINMAIVRGIIAIIFGFYFKGKITPNALYLSAFLQGTCFAFVWPALIRFIRELVSEEDLLYANASVDVAYEVGNMIGVGFAGLLIAAFSAGTTFIINGFLFFVSAFFLLLIPRSALRMEAVSKKVNSIIREFKESLVYIVDRKLLFVIYTIQILVFVQVMMAPVLLAPFAKDMLSASVKQFGYIEAAASIGIIIGGIFMPWVCERFGFLKTLIVSMALLGLCFIVFIFNRSIAVAEWIYFFIGLGLSSWPIIMTKAQSLTEVTYQARVQSTFGSVMSFIMLISYVVVSAGSEFVQVTDLYWFEVLLSVAALILLSRYGKRLSFSTPNPAF